MKNEETFELADPSDFDPDDGGGLAALLFWPVSGAELFRKGFWNSARDRHDGF